MAAEVPFREIRHVLENHGWKLARVRGSHHVFTKPGQPPISIPVHHNRVKAVYAKKIEQIVKSPGGE